MTDLGVRRRAGAEHEVWGMPSVARGADGRQRGRHLCRSTAAAAALTVPLVTKSLGAPEAPKSPEAPEASEFSKRGRLMLAVGLLVI